MNSHGFYSYMASIPANNVIQYAFIAVVSIIIANRLQLKSHTIIGLLIAILVSYYLYDREQTVDSSYLNVITHQLNSPIIRDAKYLYLDSEIVHVLFNLQRVRPSGNLIYRDLVNQLDNFLKIYHILDRGKGQLGGLTVGQLYELAQDYRTQSLNSLHSLIHKTDIDTVQFLNGQRSQLAKLLNEHLDKMYILMRYRYGQLPINRHLKIIRKNEPSGYDPLMDSHYDFH